jgi:hypothetical protein
VAAEAEDFRGLQDMHTQLDQVDLAVVEMREITE